MNHSRAAARRAAWMRKFQDALLARAPQLAGRINWDTASYFYGLGDSPESAAQRYTL